MIKDLKKLVADYKTVPAKKAALTREIKALKEYHQEIKEAFENRGGKSFGWYLGGKIFGCDVDEAETEIKTAKLFKKKYFTNR